MPVGVVSSSLVHWSISVNLKSASFVSSFVSSCFETSPGLNDESMVGVDAHGFSVGGLKVFAPRHGVSGTVHSKTIHIYIYIYYYYYYYYFCYVYYYYYYNYY